MLLSGSGFTPDPDNKPQQAAAVVCLGKDLALNRLSGPADRRI
jgi:hypothetical protein